LFSVAPLVDVGSMPRPPGRNVPTSIVLMFVELAPPAALSVS
jgi:hypothetical protein